MIRSEAKQALASKLGVSLSGVIAGQNDLFSEADLNDAIQAGVQLTWDYRSWPFAEDALTITLAEADLTNGYIDQPNTFEDGSIYLMTVNGKPWGKRVHRSYVAYFAEQPDSDAEIWADYKRLVFMNTNALSVGDEVVFYGKLRAPTLALDADRLPFSPENDNDETSGNRAVVDFAYAEILASDKKKQESQAELERKKAYQKLDLLWKPMPERDANEQNQGASFFNVPNYFGQGGGPSSTQF